MRITDVKSNYDELAYIKNLNTFQDLIGEGFVKKTSVVSKINMYLKKYKVADLNTLTELFECEFKEMKKDNIDVINKNKEVLAAGGDKKELDDIDNSVSYVLLNKDGVPIQCDIKIADGDISVFVKGTINKYLDDYKKYIAVTIAPREFKIAINIGANSSLLITCDHNEIVINETENERHTEENYFVLEKDGQDIYKHRKESVEKSSEKIID